MAVREKKSGGDCFNCSFFNHIHEFDIRMVVLPRLFYSLTRKLHRLMGTEVDATQTTSAVGTINSQGFGTWAVLHGDIADGTDLSARSATDTRIGIDLGHEGLGGPLFDGRAHCQPAHEVPAAVMISMATRLNIGDNLLHARGIFLELPRLEVRIALVGNTGTVWHTDFVSIGHLYAPLLEHLLGIVRRYTRLCATGNDDKDVGLGADLQLWQHPPYGHRWSKVVGGINQSDTLLCAEILADSFCHRHHFVIERLRYLAGRREAIACT